jgi:tRNA (guanine37-N1)-methyltransferase
MVFNIVTIFPKIFDSYFGESIVKRAQEAGLIEITTHDLRDWTSDKHKTVDDTPYGGGAGMVMKIEPLYKALKGIKSEGLVDKFKKIFGQTKKTKVVLLSAKGRPWTQAMARDYAKLDRVILICGRYEGVDERITNFIDEEISIGDYVLTGGELGAQVLVDSITRLLPGVLGNEQSAVDESHSREGVLEYPQYTRPAVFEADGQKYQVPEVLLNGNHKEIEEWKEKNSKSQFPISK